MDIEKGTTFLYSAKWVNQTQKEKVTSCIILLQNSSHFKMLTDALESVEQFHRRLSAMQYAVIFCDVIYVNFGHNDMTKEAIHVLLGITSEGYKKILEYALLLSESVLN